jgi:ribosome-binding factor A
MRIRTVPQLKFDFDSSLRDGARMDALINAAVSGNRPEEDETG